MKYLLDLENKQSLERIKELFDNHYNIMKILNEDSRESVDGGAVMNYEIKLEITEKWIKN